MKKAFWIIALLLVASFCLLWMNLPVFGQVVLWQVGAINYFWSLTALLVFIAPELLRFREERVLCALGEGKSVFLYTPGLPEVPKNRALAGSLTAAQRELKSWGVVFTDGGRKRLVTAEEARELRSKGRMPGPGAVLTPLAKEILEGSEWSAAGGR